MTISSEGLLDGAPGSFKKLVDRVNAAIASALGVVGVTASAEEINILDDATVTNQDLKDVHTNIAEINKLTTLQIDGIVASGSATSIMEELATRLMALET